MKKKPKMIHILKCKKKLKALAGVSLKVTDALCI